MPDARGREEGAGTPGTEPETERVLAAIAPEAHNYR
jgi:hypothetical protein